MVKKSFHDIAVELVEKLNETLQVMNKLAEGKMTQSGPGEIQKYRYEFMAYEFNLYEQLWYFIKKIRDKYDRIYADMKKQKLPPAEKKRLDAQIAYVANRYDEIITDFSGTLQDMTSAGRLFKAVSLSMQQVSQKLPEVYGKKEFKDMLFELSALVNDFAEGSGKNINYCIKRLVMLEQSKANIPNFANAYRGRDFFDYLKRSALPARDDLKQAINRMGKRMLFENKTLKAKFLANRKALMDSLI